MTDRQKALSTLLELAKDKTAEYRLIKVSAKEGRKVSVYVGETAKGKLTILEVGESNWAEYGKDAFCVLVGPGSRFGSIRTSVVERAGQTPEGIVLIETLNSIY